jgi:hypothetical protein
MNMFFSNPQDSVLDLDLEIQVYGRYPWSRRQWTQVVRGDQWIARQAYTDAVSLYAMYRQTKTTPELSGFPF